MKINVLLLTILVSIQALTPVLSKQAPASVIEIGQPSDSTSGIRSNSEVSLQLTEADSRALLALTDWKSDGNGKYHGLQFNVSTPFNSNDGDEAIAGSLSNLSNGTSASFEYSYLDWPLADSDIYERNREVCDLWMRKLIPGYNFGDVVQALGDGSLNCDVDTVRNKSFEDRLRGIIAKINEKKTQLSDDCSEVTDGKDKLVCNKLGGLAEAKLASNPQKLIQGFVDAFVYGDLKTTRSFTVGLKVNQQDFKFVDPMSSSGDTQEVDEQGWALSLAYSQINKYGLWTLGYSREESYEAQNKSLICNQIENSASLNCNEASLGAPSLQKKDLLFGEYRMKLGKKLSISPRVEYDAESSDWAVSVPVYFASNKENTFSSGVRLGWDEEDDFGVSLFFGTPFKLFD